jgi:ATP synthase F1 complex assembly factor 2
METALRPAACMRRFASVLRHNQCLRQQHQPTTLARHRILHSSSSNFATPISYPTAPGPPPAIPQPTRPELDERVARKRKQAELLERGRQLKPNPSKPSTALQKRFWKQVIVKDSPHGWQIYLDSRPVRTSNKRVLIIPHNKHHLATAIALEWDLLVSAQQALKHYYIPLTSLVSRATDIQEADEAGNTKIRDDLVKMLMRYLSTDTLLCWAPERNIHDPIALNFDREGESLRNRQIRTAKTIIGHLTTKVWPGVDINPILDDESIVPAAQPQMTQEVIRGWLYGLPAFELAGLERGVLASKSLLVASRLLVEWSEEFAPLRKGSEGQEKFNIQHAAEAASLEVNWQTDMWGEVEDTHDVEKEDLRRQLGSVILLVHGEKVNGN